MVWEEAVEAREWWTDRAGATELTDVPLQSFPCRWEGSSSQDGLQSLSLHGLSLLSNRKMLGLFRKHNKIPR